MPKANVINIPCQGRAKYHIFFITGNPGCIEYYRTFLTLLAANLFNVTQKNKDLSFNVFGQSLANFDGRKNSSTSLWGGKKVLGLQDQIDFVERELNSYIRTEEDLNISLGDDPSGRVRVILIGHSVGAYICMEILRRRKERGKQVSHNREERSSSIIGFIGLWPTITWIGRSRSGKLARVGHSD